MSDRLKTTVLHTKNKLEIKIIFAVGQKRGIGLEIVIATFPKVFGKDQGNASIGGDIKVDSFDVKNFSRLEK